MLVGAAIAVLLCLMPTLALADSTSTPSPGQTSGSGDATTFTVALQNEVDSFNPFLGIEAESFEMWALTYDFMITYSMTDMSPQPGLAESWETSPDGTTWTFSIRDGVKWSDGKPLTAADIAYTYNRILQGATESSTWGSYLQGVTKVEAPDARTVVMTLDKPSAIMPLLPIPVLPEHIWKDVSGKAVKSYPNEAANGHTVVGSGPFRLVSGTAGGNTYILDANPDYWQGTPSIKKLVFRVFKSEDPAIQALIKGEVDFVTDLSAVQVNSLQGKEGITAHNGDSPGFDEIAFNTGAVDTKSGKPIGDGNPALRDPAFRHALGFALDLDQLIKKVYQGAGIPGSTIIPPAYGSFHWAPSEADAFTYDPDRANQMLDDAGYTVGADGFRTQPDGTPIGTLRLAARSDSPSSLQTMTYFREWLSEVHVQAKVVPFESSKLTDVILQGNFDAFQWGWYVEPDPDSMLSYLTCGQRGNWSDSWYCNEEYDALYKEQRSEMDRDKRTELVQRMQEIAYRDSPYLVTAYNTLGEAVRSDRWACFVSQPQPNGVWIMQYGVHNYIHARPAATAGTCEDQSDFKGVVKPTVAAPGSGLNAKGVPVVLSAGLGFLLGVLLMGGLWMIDRRRTQMMRE